MAFETFEKMGGFVFYSFFDSFRLILPSGGRLGFYTLLSVLYLHIVSYWLFKLTTVQTKQTRGGQQCVAHHCCNNQTASKEPHLFLQLVLLPLGETIKGRHGQAEDSVELLRWEVALGKQGRLKALKAEGPVWLEKTHQHLQRLQAEGVKKWGGNCICLTTNFTDRKRCPHLPPSEVQCVTEWLLTSYTQNHAGVHLQSGSVHIAWKTLLPSDWHHQGFIRVDLLGTRSHFYSMNYSQYSIFLKFI